MHLTRHLNVAVCGAGAFGQNHLRIYRELMRSGAPIALAAIVESNPSAADALHREWQVPVFGSVAECLHVTQHLDAASVCVPTSAHHAVAQALLLSGVDVLVEKPIAATAEEASDLVLLAEAHQRILQPGHLERFNPAVTAIRPFLNHPMFFEAHRLSIFSPRSLDVDVVLDLMIHDLDIVLSFVQSPVQSIHAVGLPVLSQKSDIANVRIEFESGCVANFTASRVSTERVRKLRFFQPHQYVSIDYARQDLLLIDVSPEPVASPALKIEKPAVIPGEPLRLEIESFLQSVCDRTIPAVTAHDGARALQLALDINAAIAAHADRAGLRRFL
ncbi:MAG: Gfo/Idh/MocA family oxidoreductase [Acidobacteria bacterium]|nr:Gfo/Idh/MocA family oxidoreductase [Acidobacteriota bacterium]MBW4046142.1 Gfo/Idh/MocA family oxidoreductase [Acidobacteriota bacterium]